MRATVSVTLRKDGGVTVSREISVETSTYGPRESQAKFKLRVRRQAISALNSVLGTPNDLRIEQASGQ